MTRSRRKLTLDLRQAIPEGRRGLALRPLEAFHAPALAALMLAAFHGTVDDEGEDIEQARAEVRRTFDGIYGPLLWNASFVIADAASDMDLLSASVITFWHDLPLLSCAVTHPRAGRSGLATALIRESARTLARQGHTQLDLFVTRGNEPAERMYDKLGFVLVQR